MSVRTNFADWHIGVSLSDPMRGRLTGQVTGAQRVCFNWRLVEFQRLGNRPTPWPRIRPSCYMYVDAPLQAKLPLVPFRTWHISGLRAPVLCSCSWSDSPCYQSGTDYRALFKHAAAESECSLKMLRNQSLARHSGLTIAAHCCKKSISRTASIADGNQPIGLGSARGATSARNSTHGPCALSLSIRFRSCRSRPQGRSTRTETIPNRCELLTTYKAYASIWQMRN
ncbi:hypothetical protein R20943_07094 [Paraburkholderia aspalathi]|nr:hypothetical protein R20943_07094 [Paraburkholderia aspalathi]